MPGSEEEDRFEVEGSKLPGDAVAISYECSEGISRTFRLTVEFTTEDAHFDAEACLGSQVSLVLRRGFETRRIIDGVVQEVSFRRFERDKCTCRCNRDPCCSARSIGQRNGRVASRSIRRSDEFR